VPLCGCNSRAEALFYKYYQNLTGLIDSRKTKIADKVQENHTWDGIGCG
jgi:hypothetical protein